MHTSRRNTSYQLTVTKSKLATAAKAEQINNRRGSRVQFDQPKCAMQVDSVDNNNNGDRESGPLVRLAGRLTKSVLDVPGRISQCYDSF